MLELDGDVGAMLGMTTTSLAGRRLIKLGLSYSPHARQTAFNNALPEGAFKWKLIRSTLMDGDKMYSGHKVAVAGEQAMVKYFMQDGNNAESRSGEFFIASDADIEAAWQIGKRVAEQEEIS